MDTYKQGKGLVAVFPQSFKASRLSGERKGTSTDIANIKRVYEDQLKFDVELFEDLPCEDLKMAIKDVRSMVENRANEYHSLTMFILTHGGRYNRPEQLENMKQVTELDYLLASDHEKFYLSKDVIQLFDNDKCQALKGKPKMFIVQACRNVSPEKVLDGTDGVILPDSPNSAICSDRQPKPKLCDFIVVNSTLPERFAFRNEQHGSYLIRFLCEAIEKYPGMTFTDHVTMVNNAMKDQIQWNEQKTYQVCEQVSALTKNIVLHH